MFAAILAPVAGGDNYGGTSRGHQKQMERLICKYFKSQCAKAIAVARCESGLNPRAYNRAGYYGLFQMGRSWAYNWPTAWVRHPHRFYIPEVNVKAAYRLWSHGGWGHWACA